MFVGALEPEDLETVAQLLELEHKSHSRRCGIVFVMFALAFGTLVVALALVGVKLAGVLGSPTSTAELGEQFALLNIIVPLAAVALSLFGGWWAAQNCLHSIERTLFAARSRRLKLLEAFMGQIQCSGKEKQRAWLEIIKCAVS